MAGERESLADVWLRLAQLDSSCDVRVFSTRIDADRFWTAVVRRHDDPDKRFELTAPTMKEAILAAVAEAESRGMVAG